MNLSDFQLKEIISTDGKRLGKIIDANVDIATGKINYFLCEQRMSFKKVVGSNSEVRFKYENIEKIGEDVILIKI